MMPAGDEDSWYQAQSEVEEGNFEECSDFSESQDYGDEDEEDISSVE